MTHYCITTHEVVELDCNGVSVIYTRYVDDSPRVGGVELTHLSVWYVDDSLLQAKVLGCEVKTVCVLCRCFV